MKKYFILWIMSAVSQLFSSSNTNNYKILSSTGKIVIDGRLDENIWQLSDRKGQFIQHYPYDTSAALTHTEFMLAYDDEALYFAVICYDRNSQKDFVIQNLKRDFSVNNTDAVVLSISPFQDGMNGFSFGVSPNNSQREGAIENGGVFGVTTAWDQIWHSATRIVKDTWFAEMKIPFKSIRFAENNNSWKFNVSRIDFKNNEVSTWIKVPRNFNISVLNFGGEINWPESPVRRGKNIAVIPYVSTLSSGNYPYNREIFNTIKPRFGADFKIGLSSSLNLDITFNPDFAQVDVDVQQINLTRFSLFFPERRQFFIENSDLFANFGFTQIRPFFSRRIGLGSSGNLPIDAGARVTGKLNNKWRVGVMTVQTRVDTFLGKGSKNYQVLALQRKIFTASNIGFILVNEMKAGRQDFGKDKNTVTGLEYNLQSKDTRWVGKAFLQKAIYKNSGSQTISHASYLNYRNINWDIAWNHEYVGKNFRAKTGFVPRSEFFDPVLNKTFYYTYYRFEPWIFKSFYPKNSRINQVIFSLYNSSYLDSCLIANERYSSTGVKVILQNSTEFRVSLLDNYFNFYVPFSPVRNADKFMLGKFHWVSGAAGFSSNNRKKINGAVDIAFGNYYLGSRYAITGSLNFRRQPWGTLGITYRHEDIDLGQLGRSVFDLLGTKLDISFTTLMYFTSFLQYNTQTRNVNINMRFQWRYRPLSDFFIVYSENYTPGFESLNRTLALKLLYWFNT